MGGLGKVPGVYYQLLEPGDRSHMLSQFFESVDVALSMEPAMLARMARACLAVTFPVEPWALALDRQYREGCNRM